MRMRLRPSTLTHKLIRSFFFETKDCFSMMLFKHEMDLKEQVHLKEMKTIMDKSKEGDVITNRGDEH